MVGKKLEKEWSEVGKKSGELGVREINNVLTLEKDLKISTGFNKEVTDVFGGTITNRINWKE